jgi:hypothetical protein
MIRVVEGRIICRTKTNYLFLRCDFALANFLNGVFISKEASVSMILYFIDFTSL